MNAEAIIIHHSSLRSILSPYLALTRKSNNHLNQRLGFVNSSYPQPSLLDYPFYSTMK